MALHYERLVNNAEEFAFYPRGSRKLLNVLKSRITCWICALEITFQLSYGHVNVIHQRLFPLNSAFSSSTPKMLHCCLLLEKLILYNIPSFFVLFVRSHSFAFYYAFLCGIQYLIRIFWGKTCVDNLPKSQITSCVQPESRTTAF